MSSSCGNVMVLFCLAAPEIVLFAPRLIWNNGKRCNQGQFCITSSTDTVTLINRPDNPGRTAVAVVADAVFDKPLLKKHGIVLGAFRVNFPAANP